MVFLKFGSYSVAVVASRFSLVMYAAWAELSSSVPGLPSAARVFSSGLCSSS